MNFTKHNMMTLQNISTAKNDNLLPPSLHTHIHTHTHTHTQLPRWLSSKESAAMQETQKMKVRSLCLCVCCGAGGGGGGGGGGDDPLEKSMATYSSILAWIFQAEEPGGLQSVHGVAKSRTQLSNWAQTHTYIHICIYTINNIYIYKDVIYHIYICIICKYI